MTLHFYNTLTRETEAFTPIDASNVRLYACGPTVYDRAHIGNARSSVVYDVLFRLLKVIYGEEHVRYVRNITDVDDKINAAAKANNEPISALTERVTGWFHDDMGALNVQLPTIEPRATAHIPQMIAIIEKLIANGHAYAADGHVLFSVKSFPDYGCLSGRKLNEMVAGARVEVEAYKRDAGDFVLWKPANKDDDISSVFPSPWGAGRPGWHIECSAMSETYLGETFDIHGGGADLMFPHHENEIAQSRCASKTAGFARMWVHNGFLTVDGEKMSKSLGNFTTVRDLLERGVRGEVIRLALLSAHYRKPLDWNDKLLEDAQKTLDKLYRHIGQATDMNPEAPHEFLEALGDDLNFPLAISLLHHLPHDQLKACGNVLGILQQKPQDWFRDAHGEAQISAADIEALIAERQAAKQARNFAEADRIRSALAEKGVLLEDAPGGRTEWRRK